MHRRDHMSAVCAPLRSLNGRMALVNQKLRRRWCSGRLGDAIGIARNRRGLAAGAQHCPICKSLCPHCYAHHPLKVADSLPNVEKLTDSTIAEMLEDDVAGFDFLKDKVAHRDILEPLLLTHDGSTGIGESKLVSQHLIQRFDIMLTKRSIELAHSFAYCGFIL